MTKKDEFNRLALIRGILIIVFYFLGANILSIIFSFFINKSIIPPWGNIYYLLIHLIIATILILVYKKNLIIDFKIFKKNYKKDLKESLIIYLKGIFIMYASNYILISIFKLSSSVNQLENIELIKNSMITHSIIIVLIAPFLEEIVFRLSFNKMTKNPKLYAIITGVIFGTAHVISSLSNPLMILLTIPYSAMGIALGYAYKKTDTIFSSLAMHMLHNSFSLIIIIIGILGGII